MYQTLGVQLTDADVMAESAYNDALSGVIEALREAQLLTESDGARPFWHWAFWATTQ